MRYTGEMDLEERKHSLERERFDHARELDKRRLASEHFTRMVGSLSIVVPVVILLLGNFANAYQERQSRTRAVEQAKIQVRLEDEHAKLAKIDQQITKLYSPLKGMLNKDTDIWRFYEQNQDSSEPLKKSVRQVVEREYMYPNYAAISKVLEDEYDLIPIDSEDQAAYQNFLNSVNAYQRYFVILSVVRRTSPGHNLSGLDEKFPARLVPEVDQRLALLFEHRKTVVGEISRLRTEAR